MLLDLIGRGLANYLGKPRPREGVPGGTDPALWLSSLQMGDVLLVDGTSRFSTAIKYLTQSTWSHAALYVGSALGATLDGAHGPCFVEADVSEGVRALPVNAYADFHTRICRPINLRAQDRLHVVNYVIRRLGNTYDLRNVIDLARYLLPTPPVPNRWRRRMLAFGSGDPTRAICSTLIAQAFQSVRYPILPKVERRFREDETGRQWREEILHIRHHSLFAPRDFDISPYFQIIKPLPGVGFDYTRLNWADRSSVPINL